MPLPQSLKYCNTAQDAELIRSVNSKYTKGKDHRSAVADYSNLLLATKGKKRFQILFNRGVASLSLFNFDQAISDFTECISMKESAIAYNNRGLALLSLSDTHDEPEVLERALEDIQKAIQLQPTYHLAFYNLGKVYEKKNDLVNAFSSYKHATRLQRHAPSEDCVERLEPWINAIGEQAALPPLQYRGRSEAAKEETSVDVLSPRTQEGRRRRPTVATLRHASTPQYLSRDARSRPLPGTQITSSSTTEVCREALEKLESVEESIERANRLLDGLEADMKETRIHLGLPEMSAKGTGDTYTPDLPEDVLIHILSYLQPKRDCAHKQRLFLQLALVSWDWYSAVRSFPTVILISPSSVHRLLEPRMAAFRHAVVTGTGNFEPFKDTAAAVLANVIDDTKNIRELNLKNCGIGAKGAMKIALAVSRNINVFSIDLRDNTVGREACSILESEFDVKSQGRRGAWYSPRKDHSNRLLHAIVARGVLDAGWYKK